MHYSKPPITYDQQIALLKSRGLSITDDDRARRWLMRVGYYRLSAYFVPFKIPSTDTYREGATFKQVTDLYRFDEGLRLLFMQAIDRIEVAVRAVITYQLAHQLGPFGYADPANFAPTYNHTEFMRLLSNEEKRAAELFVTHYRTKYHLEQHLPVWMMTELVSFGALSKLTENLRTSLRKRLAKEYGLAEPVFISWLHTLTSVRNMCAHHNRLWNRELPVPPTLPHAWVADGVTNDRVYCVALILRYLLKIIAPKAQWKERMRAHLEAHPNIDLAAMTFPVDWPNHALWQ